MVVDILQLVDQINSQRNSKNGWKVIEASRWIELGNFGISVQNN